MSLEGEKGTLSPSPLTSHNIPLIPHRNIHMQEWMEWNGWRQDGDRWVVVVVFALLLTCMPVTGTVMGWPGNNPSWKKKKRRKEGGRKKCMYVCLR